MDRRSLRAKHLEDLVSTGPGTLGGYALRYLQDLEERNYSPHTLRTAKIHLRLFLVWCEARAVDRPEELTVSLLERYRRHLYHHVKANGDRLSFTSQYDRLGGVRRFSAWLAKAGVLDWNPASMVEAPKVERRLPKAVLTAEEAEAILAEPDITTAQGIRDRAILETFYATAVRRQELVHLTVYDVDLDALVLTVRQGKGRKDRRVPLSERAGLWIGKYVDEVRPELLIGADDGYLFRTMLTGRPLGNGVGPLVRRYKERAGVEKPGSCHLFRHTVATLMLEGGADLRYVQEMLGHADISTTQIYTKVAIRRLREVYEASHPGARPRFRLGPISGPDAGPDDATDDAAPVT